MMTLRLIMSSDGYVELERRITQGDEWIYVSDRHARYDDADRAILCREQGEGDDDWAALVCS